MGLKQASETSSLVLDINRMIVLILFVGVLAVQKSKRLEWIRTPKQARSQQTLERLLSATEKLLDREGEDAVTVAAVVKHANSSVGAFYARFGDKETLLRCVFERFYEEARATTENALVPQHWDGIPLAQVFETLTVFVTEIFLRRRGVIAAIVMRSCQPNSDAIMEALTAQIAQQVVELLHYREESVVAEDPVRAVETMVWLVISALSSWSLAGAPSSAGPGKASAFAADISTMCCRFLLGPQTRQPR